MNNDPTASLVERFETIETAAKKQARSASLVSRIVRQLSRIEGYDALKKLDRNLAHLTEAEIPNAPLRESITAATAETASWLKDEWERRATAFGGELVEHLSERAISARVEGGVVLAAPFVFSFDARNDRGRVEYTNEPVVERVPLTVERVYRAYVKALAVLQRDETPPESFSERLIFEYEELQRRRKARSGARIRLPDIHFQLFIRRQTPQARLDPRRRRIKEYPRYQFAWDLGLLVHHPEWLERNGQRIILHPASESAARSRAMSIGLVDSAGMETSLGDVQVVAA